MNNADTEQQTLTMEVNGHTVTITHEVDFSWLRPKVSIPSGLLRALDAVAVAVGSVGVNAYDCVYAVTDAEGRELVRSCWLDSLPREYGRYVADQNREQSLKSVEAQVEELRLKICALTEKGLPTSVLDDALYGCTQLIERSRWGWSASDHSGIMSALARVRNLISKFDAPFVEVVVRGLLDDSIYHRDTNHNNRVRTLVIERWIRTGGSVIELIDDQTLAEIYRQKLQECTTMKEVGHTSLRIELEDYAPAWLLDEPGVAPECLEVLFPKASSKQFPVVYRLHKAGNEQRPAGTIQMSLREYEKATRTDPTGIPGLPHGIQLIIVVTVDGQEVARGPDGSELQAQIRKNRAGKRRSANKPLLAVSAEDREVPPWYVGRTIRRR